MDGRTEGVGVAEVTAAVGHAPRWGRSVFVVARCVLAAIVVDWIMRYFFAVLLAWLPAMVAALTTVKIASVQSSPFVLTTFTILTPITGACLGGYLAFLQTLGRAPWLHAALVGVILALLAAVELTHRGASTAPTQAWIVAAVIGMKLIGALVGAAFAAWLTGGSGERDD